MHLSSAQQEKSIVGLCVFSRRLLMGCLIHVSRHWMRSADSQLGICFPNQNYSALKFLPIEAKKLLGSAEKNRVGRVTGTRTIFLFGLRVNVIFPDI